MQSLFVRVTKATGLAALIAEGVVKRACFRAGVEEPERMLHGDLQRALPSIETMLSLYLSAEEVKERIKAIGVLSRSTSGSHTFNLDDPMLDD